MNAVVNLRGVHIGEVGTRLPQGFPGGVSPPADHQVVLNVGVGPDQHIPAGAGADGLGAHRRHVKDAGGAGVIAYRDGFLVFVVFDVHGGIGRGEAPAGHIGGVGFDHVAGGIFDIEQLEEVSCAAFQLDGGGDILFPVLAVIAGEGDGGFVALLGDDGLPVVNPAG